MRPQTRPVSRRFAPRPARLLCHAAERNIRRVATPAVKDNDRCLVADGAEAAWAFKLREIHECIRERLAVRIPFAPPITKFGKCGRSLMKAARSSDCPRKSASSDKSHCPKTHAEEQRRSDVGSSSIWNAPDSSS